MLDDWEREETGKRPFLMFVNYFEVHLPYEPPEPHRSQFFTGPLRPRVRNLAGDGFSHGAIYQAIGNAGEFKEADYRQLSDLYDGCLSYQDARLRDLVQDLDRDGEGCAAGEDKVLGARERGAALDRLAQLIRADVACTTHRPRIDALIHVLRIPLVVGAAGSIKPFPVNPRLIGIDYWIMITVIAAFMLIAMIYKKISRKSGAVLLASYIAYMLYLFIYTRAE